ncbi:MAG: hypothetical protein GX442_06815 [Candidatus Riflebacteria bacterium]|nr:hypothetical protein [Candidatus Riflebacteria bacterium]
MPGSHRGRRPGQDRKTQTRGAPDPRLIDGEDFPARLFCARCHAFITATAHQMEMNGRHRHVFDNPVGLIFEIGCFREAPGCQVDGDPPTLEFTWFPGFGWQICWCRGCLEHVGWKFTGGEPASFFGLILDKLVREKSPDPS